MAGGDRMSATKRTVPVPSLGVGTGTALKKKFSELSGTFRNQRLLNWIPVKQFIEEAEQMPEPTWLINELIPSQGRVLVVAAPNSGKTWLALLAAKSSGQREVFIIEEEGSKRGIGARMNMMKLHDSRIHMLHLQGFKIDNIEQRAELISVLKSVRAPVLILDPMTSLWSGDENDTKSATQLRGHLDELIKANHEGLILVLHHTSKAAGEGMDINAGRGSSVFLGWADVQLNLKHIPVPKGSNLVEFAVKVTKNREGERDYESKLKFDLRTGEVEAMDRPVQTADDVEQQIISLLKKSINGLNKNAIIEGVKRNRQAVNNAINRLLESDVLQLTSKLYSLKAKVPDES
jgi:hypothetical protein